MMWEALWGIKREASNLHGNRKWTLVVGKIQQIQRVSFRVNAHLKLWCEQKSP